MGFQARCRMMEDVRVNRKLPFGLNVTDKLGSSFGVSDNWGAVWDRRS